MTHETIVAAFDTAEQAQAAAQAVEKAGISASDITQHASAFGMTTDVTSGQNRRGFWSQLFGDEEDDSYVYGPATLRDHSVYDKTMAGGGSVLSVKIENVERYGKRILDIIESYNPIDLEERATSYASTGATATAPAGRGAIDGSQTIQLAEEALVVGRRVVNRGTTRIRRYVVETPVSEDVSLRQENVSIQRRPVTAGTVGTDAFTDKTIEVTEMNEEAVVGKTASVVEEVLIRKDAHDRVETVHDTVRREELEVVMYEELQVERSYGNSGATRVAVPLSKNRRTDSAGATKENLLNVSRLTEKAIEVFGNAAKANVWLHRPSKALDNQVPIEMVDIEARLAEAFRLLDRIADGIAA